jgi:putative DNA primase/helicase
MRFEEFAAAHGLLLRHVEFGKWVRVPTADHPGKKNGAYRHMGTHAHVQNHATMGEVATWFPDSSDDIRIDADAIRRRCEKAARELQEGRQKAAKRAADMLRQCSLERHAYLDGKGFPDERGNVLVLESGPLLLIPMRVSGRLVGVQTITTDGEKKFLFRPAVQRRGIRDRQQGARFLLRGVRDRVECPRCAVGAEDALPGACLLFGAQPGQAGRRLPWWIGDS